MTPEREDKIRNVINRRQLDLTVVVENVHDPHNIFAIMRSCDAAGVQDIYVIDTHNIFSKKINEGKRSSASAIKWVDLHIYNDAQKCFDVVRKKYANIFATFLQEESVSLYDLDLTGSTALVFGNEKEGLSSEVLEYCDKNFTIPQAGMTKSLNVSVACAVSLYEAYRQRSIAGCYDKNTLDQERMKILFEKFSNL